jgi:hypothetical protein
MSGPQDMSMAKAAGVVIALTMAAALAGCSTNTKGAWACPADRGVPCQSIDGLDHRRTAPRRAAADAASGEAGAIRWWDGNAALTGNFDLAPRREPDQFLKVVIAGWTDAAGDYHAPSEVYAVMRRGGWWAPPPATPLTPPRRTTDAGKAASGTAPPATMAERPAIAPSPPTATAPPAPAAAAKPGQ